MKNILNKKRLKVSITSLVCLFWETLKGKIIKVKVKEFGVRFKSVSTINLSHSFYFYSFLQRLKNEPLAIFWGIYRNFWLKFNRTPKLDSVIKSSGAIKIIESLRYVICFSHILIYHCLNKFDRNDGACLCMIYDGFDERCFEMRI